MKIAKHFGYGLSHRKHYKTYINSFIDLEIQNQNTYKSNKYIAIII